MANSENFSPGVVDGRLNACPDKPNCVSTFSDSEEHKMDAVDLQNDPKQLLTNIKKIVLAEARTKLIKEEGNYLYFTQTSRIFGWVDDFEFLIDPESKKLHFRSASRTGHSDLGVNKKRMTQFLEKLKPYL